MAARTRHRCAWRGLVIGLLAVGSGAGCGTINDLLPVSKSLLPTDCESVDADAPLKAFVVLDWTGGVTPIYPRTDFVGLDLASFPMASGGTLADQAETFRERVRQEVARIYCNWPDASIIVQNGEDDGIGRSADTVVYLTQSVRPDGSFDIGQGEYDPCDQQHDNSTVIFGERIRQLAGVYTFEEWVHVFANVTAHEIAHTLGYAHVDRQDRTDVGRSLFVELMLDRHTMEEMRQPQRFLTPLTYCPDQPPSDVRTLQSADVARRPSP